MAGNQYKTNNRTKIMEFLMQNQDRTVSVNDIDTHLKTVNCPVNVTTIYRYLDKLEEDGNVIKYASEKGDKGYYQYVETEHGCTEHLHLKCTECGSVSHLDCHFMEEIEQHISKDHGFVLQCKNSVIYGICGQCQRGKQKR